MKRLALLSIMILLTTVSLASASLSGGFKPVTNPTKVGLASMYGKGSFETASGRSVNSQRELFAAHKSLPFGSKVKISRGNRSVVVVIVDRGPYVAGRVFDLSYRAASILRMTAVGVASVRYQVL